VSRPLTIGSLFSGIGGLELGLERAGLGPVLWQVEKDEYCRAVLAKHWPDATRYEDVKDVGGHNLARVDVICGGFPCQDISYAGPVGRAGIGISGRRSGLWYEFARIVGELGPGFVVVENVAALLDGGIGHVLGTLADLGYDAEWSNVSACSVGGSHVRQRVFIVAHANVLGLSGRLRDGKGFGVQAFPSASVRWNVSAPFVCRGSDGVPGRPHRLRGLGNAVVPQVAEVVGRVVLALEAQREAA
jgi:DNA (cytosine-5)-methyltransferase 1